MKTKLNREIVLRTMRGYAEVNRITEAERRARLQHMTDAEARAIFEGLRFPVHEMEADERARLMPLRLAQHRKVREAMQRLAARRGYGSTL